MILAAVLLGFAALQGFAADKYKIMTYAGTGDYGYSGDGGPATKATLSLHNGKDYLDICFDSHDSLFFTDSCRIRRVDASGIITTVAGNGKRGQYSGEGWPAVEAVLRDLTGICFDDAGNMYLASLKSDLFYRIDAAGMITTVGGGGNALPLEDKD